MEAAGYGFDEIQYDYVRFPTDGDLTTMDFGVEYSQEARVSGDRGIPRPPRERLLPTGALQSADVFGFAMVVMTTSGSASTSHRSPTMSTT